MPPKRKLSIQPDEKSIKCFHASIPTVEKGEEIDKIDSQILEIDESLSKLSEQANPSFKEMMQLQNTKNDLLEAKYKMQLQKKDQEIQQLQQKFTLQQIQRKFGLLMFKSKFILCSMLNRFASTYGCTFESCTF